MKKIICILAFLAFQFCAKAQDTLRSSDLPSASDKFVLSIGVAFAGMDPIATGPNYDWDYSDLGRSSQRLDTMLLPSATNPFLSFFFINSSLNTNRSNLASKGQNFNLGIIGLEDVFNYYYNSVTSFSQPGFGAVVDSIPIPVAYTPHDVLYNFPLTYNNEDSVSYTYNLDLISTIGIYYEVRRTRHNLVDGWGTLTTPYGTFDVLRIKSMLYEQDSIYIDTFHTGIKPPPVTTYEYKWLGRNFGLPLLQVNTNSANAVTQILYQDSIHLTGIAEYPAISYEPVLFPNPANDKVIISYDLNSNKDVFFELFDSNGRKIFSIEDTSRSAGKNFKSIDLSPYKLAVGNYFLKVVAGNSVFTKQLQIE